jgi:hypothetical protein
VPEESKAMMLKALVTETRGEVAFLTFLSKVVEDAKVKEAAKTELVNHFDPASRATVRETRITQEETEANNLDKALAEALDKLSTCSAVTEQSGVAKAASESRASLRSLNSALRAAGRGSQQFSPGAIASIDIAGDAAGVSLTCAGMIDTVRGLVQ